MGTSSLNILYEGTSPLNRGEGTSPLNRGEGTSPLNIKQRWPLCISSLHIGGTKSVKRGELRGPKIGGTSPLNRGGHKSVKHTVSGHKFVKVFKIWHICSALIREKKICGTNGLTILSQVLFLYSLALVALTNEREKSLVFKI